VIWPLLYSATMSRSLRWTTVEDYDDPRSDSPPQSGTHLVYEFQFRSDQAATVANLPLYVNDDLDFNNYHFQRYLSLNAAAAATEATNGNGGQIPGSSAVAGVYGFMFVFFPFFRNARQKSWMSVWTLEEAATAQDLCIHVQKRHTAGSGALTDAITKITLDNALDEATDGTLRRAIIP
jgi:hypothetical protein